MAQTNQYNAEVYNRYVDEYTSKFMDLGLYKDTFDHLIELLPANATVLELGCGPGNVIKYLTSKRGDLKATGIDLAPAMIEEAKKHNPDSEFKVMDIRNVGQIAETFDAVIAAFCIPYMDYNDMPALFADCRKLTKNLFYISFMEGTRSRSGLEQTSFTGNEELHINYYPRQEIASLLQANGFNVQAFYTKDYPEADGSTTTEIIYIANV